MNQTIIDKLVTMASDFALSRTAARELDPRLADALEAEGHRLVCSARECVNQLAGLEQLGMRTSAMAEKQIQMIINAAYAEYTDRALELWDRYKDVWLIQACYEKAAVNGFD